MSSLPLNPPRARVLRLSSAVGALLAVIAGLLGGLGWLYFLRGLHWFSAGPQVPDALPLLQLAGTDRQPLLRVVIAWLLAGVLTGLVLARLPRIRRVIVVALLALIVLLVASQASHALTRNIRFGSTLFSRVPASGPWLEAVLFTAGCLVPGRLRRGRGQRGIVLPRPGLRNLTLSQGQSRYTAEHQYDR
jgi:hypothetical protein